MGFDANLFQQLTSQGVDTASAAQAATTPDVPAAPVPAAPPVPVPSFQAPQAQGQYSAPQNTQTAPAPELARGTLEDFYNQPAASNGGKGATQFFGSLQRGNRKPDGTWLHLRIDRDITNADVSQLTDTNNVPQTWKYGPLAGKPKFQLVVPATAIGSSDGTHEQFFEGGAVRLYLKPGPVTDSFRAALQAAGENSGFPKAGSQLVMIAAGQKANKGNYSPTMLYDFQYTPPQGDVQVESPAENPAPVAAPVPASSGTPAPAPAPAPASSSTPTPSGTPAPVPNLAPDKAALLAKLQGQG